ncbi:hypothetical protein DL96DRAFT_1562627 [Flagelloscypha sp. PMI_526]|nr:hypothetical protein DL96DRAFT_1562627 [Flagelloscypha sp. PMI_526]
MSLLALVRAQQYEGDPVNLTIPDAVGAEKTFFRIWDAEGQPTTLINYFSLPVSTGQRPPAEGLQRIVIVLTGTLRDAWNYFADMRNALIVATGVDPNVNDTPWWANDDDFQLAQAQHSSGTKRIYPNMKQIVVSGHSRGAQMSIRYAVIGKQLPLHHPEPDGVKLLYYTGNPSSFVWLNSSRPIDPGTCTKYDWWSEGLGNYTNTYNTEFVQGDLEVIRKCFEKRDVAYARGLNDFGKSDDDCPNILEGKPVSQGANRGERFYNFLTYFPPDASDTVDYVEGTGHNDAAMFASDAGIHRLFLDNFYGDGSRHADFGPRYADHSGGGFLKAEIVLDARQIPGDNPHPESFRT